MSEQQQQAPANTTNVYVTQERRGPNHVLHAILSILTGGLWLPVWLIIAIRRK